MKVKYNTNIYEFKGDLNCIFFKNLIEEGIEEVELSLYEDVFVKLLNNELDFNVEKNYPYLYKGLSYFGSNKEKDLMTFVIEREEKLYFDFLETCPDGYWGFLSRNPSVPFKFMEKNIKRIVFDWGNPKFPLSFILKHINTGKCEYSQLEYPYFCRNISIPLKYFEDNIHRFKTDSLCWYHLSERSDLTFEFINKYLEHLSFPLYFQNSAMTYSNLMYFMPRMINRYCNQFNDHSDKMQENIRRNTLCLYWAWHSEHDSIEILKEHVNEINFHSDHIYKNPNMTIEFLKTHLDKVNWKYLCEYVKADVEFLEKHLDKIHWNELCENTHIPVEFFERHLDKIEWNRLCRNSNIPFNFFTKNLNLDKEKIERLCYNPNVPLEFFEQHFDNLNWHGICTNPGIPIEFFMKHKDKIIWYVFSEYDFKIKERIDKVINNLKYI